MLVGVCTFVMEMLLPQQRIALRAFFNWGIGRIMLTLICYVAGDWRTASLYCAAVVSPALIALIIFPESPTWLHSKGRLDKMRVSEKKIARLAGEEYTPVTHQKLPKAKSLLEVLKSGLLKRLLVLWMMWFTASTCAYANDLVSNTLSGDLYTNQLLIGVLLYISKIILGIVDAHFSWFTRRLLHQGGQLGAVICFSILCSFILTEYKGLFFLIINILGTIFVEYTWDACYLSAVESIETSSRASAMGSCSLMARFGALLAPSLTYLHHAYPGSVYIVVVVLGAINLLQSYVFLVETKGVELDTVTVADDGQRRIPPENEVELHNTERRS